MSDFDRFNKKGDAMLIAMLASGATTKEAAEAAGISERTARRRLQEPDFLQLVGEARAGLIDRASSTLASGMVEAANTLKELLKANSERTRLGAAKALILLGLRAREVGELEDRLRELERAIQ
jgi:hypothetical protein